MEREIEQNVPFYPDHHHPAISEVIQKLSKSRERGRGRGGERELHTRCPPFQQARMINNTFPFLVLQEHLMSLTYASWLEDSLLYYENQGFLSIKWWGSAPFFSLLEDQYDNIGRISTMSERK